MHVHWLWIEFDLSCLWYVASIIYWSPVLSLSVISMPAIASPLRGPAHLQTHMHTQRLLLSLFSWILAAMQVARVTAGISPPFSLCVCVCVCEWVWMCGHEPCARWAINTSLTQLPPATLHTRPHLLCVCVFAVTVLACAYICWVIVKFSSALLSVCAKTGILNATFTIWTNFKTLDIILKICRLTLTFIASRYQIEE